MIDKPGEVAHLALVDLVRPALCAAYHDIYARDAICYKPDEFADGRPAVKVHTGHYAIVLSAGGTEYLNRSRSLDASE